VTPSAAGLFLSHIKSPRIRRHFDRLVEETRGLLTWRWLYCPKRSALSPFRLGPNAIGRGMEPRATQMRKNGTLNGGFADVAFIPRALALGSEFVWVMEYDVDFSGRWDDFFRQFGDNRADLLTTSLAPRAECPDWYYWPSARAPDGVSEERMYRSFNPILRISRRFARHYSRAFANADWRGHNEFTLPTIALVDDFRVEDIGGRGSLCPDPRKGRNYFNNPENHLDLGPGTFLWRPSLKGYFHEAPDQFASRDMLYHPVKADVPDWEIVALPRKRERLISV